jgi:hypothetical protein
MQKMSPSGPRDDIVEPAASSAGSPKNASAGRIKSVSGPGPGFSPHKTSKLNSAPPPTNPYGN